MTFFARYSEHRCRRRAAWLVLLGAVCTLATTGCRDEKKQPDQSKTHHASSLIEGLEKTGSAHVVDQAAASTERLRKSFKFVDVHSEAGIDHTYQNGMSGKQYMVEAIGGGCGWLDFDGDGLWDLYVNQGGDPTEPPQNRRPSDRLYRNIGGGKFTDVTEGAGIHEAAYGQGVAVADYDADGFDDVYVTNVGGNILWHNEGDGTFRNVTDAAGVGGGLWSTSAAWADIDLDGDLDLYVCNYTEFDPRHPIQCRDKHGVPHICHPKDVNAVPDECYINQGDGTFRPEAKERGLFGEGNKALGVIVADLTNDGWPDIFVANDTCPNFLFVNQGQGIFYESAYLLGCAVDRNGARRANMGLALGDYDRNDLLDVFSTNFFHEGNLLLQNLGPQGFRDATAIAGIHTVSYERLGFGTVMADFNLDGAQDIVVANGHIDPETNDGGPYREKATLFSYAAPKFVDVSSTSGEYFQRALVGRGVASCDFDGDGDLDLAIVNQNDPLVLLRNDSKRNHWLNFQFVGAGANRRGIGARVTLHTSHGEQMRELAGGTSFAVTHQPILNFGLEADVTACDVDVSWPQGARQHLTGVKVDQLIVLWEPAGEHKLPVANQPIARSTSPPEKN